MGWCYSLSSRRYIGWYDSGYPDSPMPSFGRNLTMKNLQQRQGMSQPRGLSQTRRDLPFPLFLTAMDLVQELTLSHAPRWLTSATSEDVQNPSCTPIQTISLGFPGGSVVKNLPVSLGDMESILGREDPLEKAMATHSSNLACEIP